MHVSVDRGHKRSAGRSEVCMWLTEAPKGADGVAGYDRVRFTAGVWEPLQPAVATQVIVCETATQTDGIECFDEADFWYFAGAPGRRSSFQG